MNITEYIDKESLQAAIRDMPLDSRMYVAEVPNDIYHSTSGWSSSPAKKAFLSEQRLHKYLTKDHNPKSPAHFVFGELVHDSVRLDEAGIDKLYCSGIDLYGPGTNATKAIKECLATGKKKVSETDFNIDYDKYPDTQKMLDEINGREIVKPSEIADARHFAALLRDSYHVRNALAKYDHFFELSIWHKDKTGFIRKCRPDLWFPAIQTVFDWKSTREIVWTFDTGDRHTYLQRELSRQIDKLDYGFSAGWYLDVMGIDPDEGAFGFVFADKSSLEVYPLFAMTPDRIRQEFHRCYHAITVIKSYERKLDHDRNPIVPLDMFVPNDDHIFYGKEKQFQ